MADKKDEYEIKPSQITDLAAIHRVDESRFTAAMDEVVKESEDMRLRYMRQHGSRAFLTMSFGMFMALAGACGFGWYFLVEMNLAMAALCMVPALLVPFLMHSWSEAPIKHYIRDYKKIFMPKMAAALGGFKFYPSRGIPRDVIGKTGVVPAHDYYKAEDCFMGSYKGAKVIFSEASLRSGRSTGCALDQGVSKSPELRAIFNIICDIDFLFEEISTKKEVYGPVKIGRKSHFLGERLDFCVRAVPPQQVGTGKVRVLVSERVYAPISSDAGQRQAVAQLNIGLAGNSVIFDFVY